MVAWRVPLMMLIMLLMVVVVLLGGCGDNEREPAGSGGESTVAGNEELAVGYGEEPAILNPFIIGGEPVATGDLVAGILEKPYEIQPDLSLAPELAEG